MSQPARRPYQPRRRGFDDDQPSAPDINWGALNGGGRSSAPAAFGPTLSATVKWFNPEKGFWFRCHGGRIGRRVFALRRPSARRARFGQRRRFAGSSRRSWPEGFAGDRSCQRGHQHCRTVSRPALPFGWPARPRRSVRPDGGNDRDGQVVQPDQGFRLHRTAGRRQGYFRSYVRSRQPAHAQRGPGGARFRPPGRQGPGKPAAFQKCRTGLPVENWAAGIIVGGLFCVRLTSRGLPCPIGSKTS